MNNSKGLSLIETAMVLALAAIVTAGVMFYYNSAAQNKKNTDTMQFMQEILMKANSLYANQPDTFNLTGEVISKALPGIKTNPLACLGSVDSTGLKIPGSGNGYFCLSGGGGKLVSLTFSPTTASAESYYDTCMTLTGGNFGTSFRGYADAQTLFNYTTDQSVKARHDFCKRKSAAPKKASDRNISFLFQIG